MVCKSDDATSGHIATLTDMSTKIVFDDDEEIVLPDDYVLVPDASGWFSFTSEVDSVEKYGITWAEYHEMLDAQDGNCAICDRHPTSVGQLVVDHDHSTDKVRGLLCQRCNLALGLFLDNPDAVKAAHDYLYEHGCWLTKPLSAEDQESMARFVMPPHEYQRHLRWQGECGWMQALRDVFDCQNGRKEAPVKEAWERFWETFRSCIALYDHPERAVLNARDEWVKLGGDPADFLTP